MTVTYLSPLRVCRQICSSTPMTSTPLKRSGSLIKRSLARSRTASPSVSHDTPNPAATRATDMNSTPTARIAHSTAARVSTARLATARDASCHPHAPTALAAPAPQPHQQVRGPPAQRHVRQTPGHGPHRCALGPADPAERVLLQGFQAALHQRPLPLQAHADGGQPQGVQAQETSKIRSSEGSLGHVEVSVIGSGLQPPIIGDLDPHPPLRHAHPRPPHHHTPKPEEPLKLRLRPH